MYRNISIMLLVLFAVVLILPTFQGEGFSSGVRHHCNHDIDPAGEIYCKLHGSQGVTGYSLTRCLVGCSNRSQTLRMPRNVCPDGSLTCNEKTRETLTQWRDDMQKRKQLIVDDWCRG
uniref:Putative secreted salivary WC peptide n=1 Tax=Ixodes scapularis TaxID=6945 RepID=Q4PNB2_IXOSC|nr:putative secreted salivary WC peptide [Ixodes scapularis]